MVEDVVVAKETLTEAMIRAGQELIRKLDEINWPVTACLWFYFPESNRWKLLVASPVVKREGPKRAYSQLLEVLKQIPEDTPRVALEDLVAIEDDHPLVALLGKAARVSGKTAGVRLSRNAIDGQLIEDAYIYRLDAGDRG